MRKNQVSDKQFSKVGIVEFYCDLTCFGSHGVIEIGDQGI